MSGVSFDVSNYLSTHPDVNNYFTSLMGQPKDQIRAQVQTYVDANPQVKDDLQRIRQPAVDFRTRCRRQKVQPSSPSWHIIGQTSVRS